MKSRKIEILKPPSTIAIIGGGQLGRMVTFEAKRMGYNVVILDPKPNSPASQVADKQITADFNDFEALKELAKISDVITYEFEHINAELLSNLEAEGYKIYPSANTLKLIQDKYVQKKMLIDNGIRTPRFSLCKDIKHLKELFHLFGNKAMLKTCKYGYDGKGNILINNVSRLEKAYYGFANLDIMIEEYINLSKEVSVIVARNSEGMEIYPISENIHKNSILIKSRIPADISDDVAKCVISMSREVVELIDDYGVFCIEFFIDKDSNVYVNEIAPRPHNSGHYSIEGCFCSQFEQLVRIICGLPLGSSKMISQCAMYNILGSEQVEGRYIVNGVSSALEIKNCYLHLYGKLETAPLKKIGHITALDDSLDIADKKAEQALNRLTIESIK